MQLKTFHIATLEIPSSGKYAQEKIVQVSSSLNQFPIVRIQNFSYEYLSVSICSSSCACCSGRGKKKRIGVHVFICLYCANVYQASDGVAIALELHQSQEMVQKLHFFFVLFRCEHSVPSILISITIHVLPVPSLSNGQSCIAYRSQIKKHSWKCCRFYAVYLFSMHVCVSIRAGVSIPSTHSLNPKSRNWYKRMASSSRR